jgi:hypothetical protein
MVKGPEKEWVVVATVVRAVPAEFVYVRELAVSEVAPVPPLETARAVEKVGAVLKVLVPLQVLVFARSVEEAAKEEVAMNARPPVVLFQPSTCPPWPVPKSVEVAWKVGTVEPGAAFAKTPLVARPKDVALLPEEVTAPERLAFVVTVAALPLMLMAIAEEVATEAKVFTPVAYRRPEAAEIGDEVLIPPKERLGAVPPEEMIGQVPVTAVTEPPPLVDVAIKARPPVTFDQPSTCPPTPTPYRVEVA